MSPIDRLMVVVTRLATERVQCEMEQFMGQNVRRVAEWYRTKPRFMPLFSLTTIDIAHNYYPVSRLSDCATDLLSVLCKQRAFLYVDR